MDPSSSKDKKGGNNWIKKQLVDSIKGSHWSFEFYNGNPPGPELYLPVPEFAIRCHEIRLEREPPRKRRTQSDDDDGWWWPAARSWKHGNTWVHNADNVETPERHMPDMMFISDRLAKLEAHTNSDAFQILWNYFKRAEETFEGLNPKKFPDPMGEGKPLGFAALKVTYHEPFQGEHYPYSIFFQLMRGGFTFENAEMVEARRQFKLKNPVEQFEKRIAASTDARTKPCTCEPSDTNPNPGTTIHPLDDDDRYFYQHIINIQIQYHAFFSNRRPLPELSKAQSDRWWTEDVHLRRGQEVGNHNHEEGQVTLKWSPPSGNRFRNPGVRFEFARAEKLCADLRCLKEDHPMAFETLKRCVQAEQEYCDASGSNAILRYPECYYCSCYAGLSMLGPGRYGSPLGVISLRVDYRDTEKDESGEEPGKYPMSISFELGMGGFDLGNLPVICRAEKPVKESMWNKLKHR